MKNLLFLVLFCSTNSLFAQVYNFGVNEVIFRNMIKNGITYVRTGNPEFDSLMLSHLDKHWDVTDFTVVDQYKRPEKTSTALFITTKEITRKHMMDRKNQHVLVLQPAEIYVPRKKIVMEQTLGYMYFNGFYDLVTEEDEYRFSEILVKALNKGLSFIQSKQLRGEPEELNEKVSEAVRGTDGPSVGNTLILNREQTRHAVDKELLDKMGIRYRLLAEEEYYATLEKKNPEHIILYFAINRFTEMGLVNVATSELLYAKHFRDGYLSLDKKELKAISGYFQ